MDKILSKEKVPTLRKGDRIVLLWPDSKSKNIYVLATVVLVKNGIIYVKYDDGDITKISVRDSQYIIGKGVKEKRDKPYNDHTVEKIVKEWWNVPDKIEKLLHIVEDAEPPLDEEPEIEDTIEEKLTDFVTEWVKNRWFSSLVYNGERSISVKIKDFFHSLRIPLKYKKVQSHYLYYTVFLNQVEANRILEEKTLKLRSKEISTWYTSEKYAIENAEVNKAFVFKEQSSKVRILLNPGLFYKKVDKKFKDGYIDSLVKEAVITKGNGISTFNKKLMCFSAFVSTKCSKNKFYDEYDLERLDIDSKILDFLKIWCESSELGERIYSDVKDIKIPDKYKKVEGGYVYRGLKLTPKGMKYFLNGQNIKALKRDLTSWSFDIDIAKKFMTNFPNSILIKVPVRKLDVFINLQLLYNYITKSDGVKTEAEVIVKNQGIAYITPDMIIENNIEV